MHELGQPLQAIQIYLGRCAQLLKEGHTPRDLLCKAVDETLSETNRATAAITRLRSFLKRGELQKTALAIQLLVDELLKLAEPTLHQHQTVVTTDLPDEPLVLQVDQIQLMQVLLNLLLNAAQAMQGLSAEQRRIELHVRRLPEDRVQISVRDYGTGFQPGQHEAVFRPFHTTKPQGLGLGLSISRTIVEAHHGTIRAESPAVGSGAVLVIELPMWTTRSGS